MWNHSPFRKPGFLRAKDKNKSPSSQNTPDDVYQAPKLRSPRSKRDPRISMSSPCSNAPTRTVRSKTIHISGGAGTRSPPALQRRFGSDITHVRSRSQSSLRTKQINADTITPKPRSIENPDAELSGYQIMIDCIVSLTSTTAYKNEGILRVSGNFGDVQAATTEIHNTSQKENQVILERLGPHGTSDILKQYLKAQETPLIPTACFKQICDAPQLKFCLNHQVFFSQGELTCIYINTVLNNMLTNQRYNLLSYLLNYLQLVVSHERYSKMGLRAVATIFAPIIFGSPTAATFDGFVEENDQRISLLLLILQLYTEHDSLFIKTDSRTQIMIIRSTQRVQGHLIVIGEELTMFHRSNNFVFFRHNQYLCSLSTEEACVLLSPLNSQTNPKQRLSCGTMQTHKNEK